jgi:hypothetical protein
MSSSGSLLEPSLTILARIVQHHLRGELAHAGSLALFLEAHDPHFLVAIFLVEAVARRAAPVGDDHACEPFVPSLEALQYRVRRHDLDIVLMGGKAQVRGARQCCLHGHSSGTNISAVSR